MDNGDTLTGKLVKKGRKNVVFKPARTDAVKVVKFTRLGVAGTANAFRRASLSLAGPTCLFFSVGRHVACHPWA